MPHLSTELQVLLDAVRWHVHPGLEFSESKSVNEEVLFELALKHNLLPWLFPFFKAFNFGSDELMKRIVSYLLESGIRNQLQTRELVKLSSLLTKKGLDHVILKGITIEKQFYKGFVNSRYSDDIDILIGSNDLDKACRLILSEGYAQCEPHDLSKLARFLEKYEAWFRWRDVGFKQQTASKICIDLHWKLADDFTIPVKALALLKQVEVLPVSNKEIPTLPFAILFVYVCVHGYIDYFFRLRYLVDVYAAMQQPEFDIDEVMNIAQTWGVVNKVIESMETANYFFSAKHEVNGEHVRISNAYTKCVYQRYIDSSGLPARSHPNRGVWTALDKREHLKTQIKFRSSHVSFFSPIIARCKYNHDMVAQWPLTVPIFLWYPFALLKRLFKSN